MKTVSLTVAMNMGVGEGLQEFGQNVSGCYTEKTFLPATLNSSLVHIHCTFSLVTILGLQFSGEGKKP